MSRESHRAYLEKVALKAAQRAIDRNGGGKLTESQARQLRVQTIEPWKRITIALIGAALGGLSYACFHSDIGWLGVILGIGSMATFIIALAGRRKDAAKVFDGLDLLLILDALL